MQTIGQLCNQISSFVESCRSERMSLVSYLVWPGQRWRGAEGSFERCGCAGIDWFEPRGSHCLPLPDATTRWPSYTWRWLTGSEIKGTEIIALNGVYMSQTTVETMAQKCSCRDSGTEIFMLHRYFLAAVDCADVWKGADYICKTLYIIICNSSSSAFKLWETMS